MVFFFLPLQRVFLFFFSLHLFEFNSQTFIVILRSDVIFRAQMVDSFIYAALFFLHVGQMTQTYKLPIRCSCSLECVCVCVWG